MVRPMVHSRKHYVQQAIAEVGAGAVVTTGIAVAVETPTAVNHIQEGSSVKAVYVERWMRGGTSSLLASGQSIVYKKMSDSTNPSATDLAALGDWDNKKNILYTTMGLFNTEADSAIAIIRQWIKIPKSKQRFGLGDSLNISSFAAVASDFCGFQTYKEYT